VKRLPPLLLLSLFFALLFGCSFDYEEARIAEDLAEEVPETVIIDFSRTRIDGGRPKFEISGSRAATYGKRMETEVEELLFREFGEDGDVTTEGRADRILISSETEDADIEGNIRFYHAEEETGIEAESLSWNNGERILTGEEGKVTVSKKSGSTLTGEGFRADLRRKRIEFSGGARGSWVEEEDEEAPEETADE
jgi:LPS export ABC transporter protein LptC